MCFIKYVLNKLSFSKQSDTSLQRAVLKFSHDDHNKDNDWIFNINEICISNKIHKIKWPITFSVCRARFCGTKHTFHTTQEDSSLKYSIWKCNVTYEYYSNGIAYRCLSFLILRCLLSTSFVKSVGNTHRTHTDYDWSVFWVVFCLICKLHWCWRSNRYLFRNRRVKI